jgi:F-type H+-transporting ATPase subunit a
MASPIAQFEIKTLSEPFFHLMGAPVALTNSAVMMILVTALSTLLMIMAMRPAAIVPGRLQMLVEILHNMVAGVVDSSAGPKSKPYFPFVFSIFMFILLANMLGMIPHSFTITSHLIVNLALALLIFLVITVTGFVKHGVHFLHLFVPSGVPGFLLPIMIFIELLSFLIRPLSLSIRLFANMLAGHILLKVFATMTAGLMTTGALAVIGVLPLALNIAITGFEFFVAFLQAYIFAILTSVYLRDALEMH